MTFYRLQNRCAERLTSSSGAPQLVSGRAGEAVRHPVSGPGLFLLNHVEHQPHTEIIFRSRVVFYA